MDYWKIKEKENIFKVSDLNNFKKFISYDNKNNIIDMIEWEQMNYEERLRNSIIFSFFSNLNTNNKNNQEKKDLTFTLIKSHPYKIDWIVENWNQIIKDLNFNYNFQEFLPFIFSKLHLVNYKFNCNNNNKDTWNVANFDDQDLLIFISQSIKEKKRLSIYYLYNPTATLEKISKNFNLKITRERVRQLIINEINFNFIFFNKIFNLIKNNKIKILNLNKSALRVIEKILYPEINDNDSILQEKNKLVEKVIFDFKNNGFLSLQNEKEKNILFENNCIVNNNNEWVKTDEKYWKKNLNFSELLLIFLQNNYKNGQILNKEELRENFLNFLQKNLKKENYYENNSRSFNALLERTKELIFYNSNNLIYSNDSNNINYANQIINEFKNLEDKKIIMISAKKYITVFNKLTNYEYLEVNNNFMHNFLRKFFNNKNNEIIFSRSPIIINSKYKEKNVINVFYKQVCLLFEKIKDSYINWNSFVEILENECGFEKTLIQNYISQGYLYFEKINNKIKIK